MTDLTQRYLQKRLPRNPRIGDPSAVSRTFRSGAFLAGILALGPACSLINAYDEVKGAGGGGTGAGNQGGSGAGNNTGGNNTGGQVANGGGGAGGGPALFDCAFAGQATKIDDLSAQAGMDRTYRQRIFATMPHGDTIRFAVQYANQMAVYDVNTNTQMAGMPALYTVREMLAGRDVGNGHLTVLATIDNGFNQPYPLMVFDWPQNANPQSPTTATIHDGVAFPSTDRAAFSVSGVNTLELLFRYSEAANQNHLMYGHFEGGSLTKTIELKDAGAAVTPTQSDPHAVVLAGGTIHAFAGSFDNNLNGGALRWTFPASSTTSAQAGNPQDTGVKPSAMLDAEVAGQTVKMSFGVIDPNDTSISLRAGEVPFADVGTTKADDLPEVISFSSFLDVPNSGEPRYQAQLIPLFGPNQTSDDLIMLLAKSDGTLRFYSDSMRQADTAAYSYGDIAAIVSNQPLATFGGVGYAIWSERVPDPDGPFDRLMYQQFACGN